MLVQTRQEIKSNAQCSVDFSNDKRRVGEERVRAHCIRERDIYFTLVFISCATHLLHPLTTLRFISTVPCSPNGQARSGGGFLMVNHSHPLPCAPWVRLLRPPLSLLSARHSRGLLFIPCPLQNIIFHSSSVNFRFLLSVVGLARTVLVQWLRG